MFLAGFGLVCFGLGFVVCLFLNYVMGVCDCLFCWVLGDCVDVDGIRGGLVLDRFVWVFDAEFCDLVLFGFWWFCDLVFLSLL